MIFQPVEWSSEVKEGIAPAFSLYPHELELLEDDIQARRIAVYRLDDLGLILVKLLQHKDHKELFVVAACGREMERAAIAIETKAFWLGFHVVKWHTRRKGITRKAERMGYTVKQLGQEWECVKWVRAVRQIVVKEAQPA